jgi:hypothetical protein
MILATDFFQTGDRCIDRRNFPKLATSSDPRAACGQHPLAKMVSARTDERWLRRCTEELWCELASTKTQSFDESNLSSSTSVTQIDQRFPKQRGHSHGSAQQFYGSSGCAVAGNLSGGT